PLAVLPLPDNRANIIWTEPKDTAETLEAMRDQDFEAELRLRAGDFIGPFELIGHRFAYPLSLRMAESFTADRVALAGDAAHVIHPLAGQGVNLGLKDVAALVETIADARQVGLDIGAETALEPYNRWRRFDTLAMASATEGLARVFRAARPIRSLAGVGMGLSGRMAGLRRAMAAEAGGVFGDLPRLMRGEPVR
ncbi:MAG: FAD-dependent monooxygenase, partial [Pseudomonadota bacterium]